MTRVALAALILPLAFSTSLPLPKRPKGMSGSTYRMVIASLKQEKQFDLTKLGIPVEKSLRFAGMTRGPASDDLAAISPKSVDALVAWYQHHLEGWEVRTWVKGSLATLAPKGATEQAVMQHRTKLIDIMACRQGKYQLLSCRSFLTFIKPKPHPGH